MHNFEIGAGPGSSLYSLLYFRVYFKKKKNFFFHINKTVVPVDWQRCGEFSISDIVSSSSTVSFGSIFSFSPH